MTGHSPAPGGPIRVVVADDQAIVRDGLVTMLDIQAGVEVVGQAANGVEALRACLLERPDVVLLDLRMPEMDGVEATRRIRAQAPGVAILVLTTFADSSSVVQALRAGAAGYLTKDVGRVELVGALRAVAAGQSVYAGDVAQLVVSALPEPGVPDQVDRLRRLFPALSRREAQVLDLMGRGLGNREIAEDLVLEVSTVKSHVNAVFAKLGVTRRSQAVALARDSGR